MFDTSLTGCPFQGPTLIDVVESHPNQARIPPTARQPAEHVAPRIRGVLMR